ncbi:MAG: exonuclease domain-containing protein [Bacteroidales bacterium]|jgi:DNA polymerase-3 subunit epsilon|nr:exonuclease domain-containing protein [Bacteroidales bacterium]
MFAIIDVETTGLNPAGERITEIAVYLHDGQKITDEYQTLLNPEKRIPFQITGLTGISNRMVADQPRFCEVAKDIVEMTEDRIIVGHNVAFDYRFLRAEFKRLFYDFKRKTLCTKQLSRKLIPKRASYGLGSLCKDLGIENEARHRAAGDALATVKLFEHLRGLEDDLLKLSLRGLNSGLSKKIVDQLPEECGVYYFVDGQGEIIYVGKSLNIRDRILSHLSNNNTKRAMEMRDRVADIKWELTGSELIALLLESDEIKRRKPVFNRSQRRSTFQYGLFVITDVNGYKWLQAKRINGTDAPLTSYTTQKEARAHLQYLVDEYHLCQKLCGLYPSNGACFYHQINRCYGACTGKESPEEYNERVDIAIEKYVYRESNFFVIDKGRHEDERAVVKVCNGSYRGFGYIPEDDIENKVLLNECIQPYADNKDVQVIIKGYLRKHPDMKVLGVGC